VAPEASITFRFRKDVSDRIPRNAQQRLETAMRAAIVRSTRFGFGLAFGNINKRTGQTALTINERIVGGGSHVEGRWGSSDNVALILEKGSRAHRIPGSFGIPQGVWHPGTRPYRWLERSGAPAGAVAKAELRAAFASVFGLG